MAECSALQFIKSAEDTDRKKQPGFMGRQAASHRAQRDGNRVLTDSKQMKEIGRGVARGTGKGVAVGAAAGAAIGVGTALHKTRSFRSVGQGAALGTAAGAMLGGRIGASVGASAAQTKNLEAKGIKRNALGAVKSMTPGAKKQYLHKKYEGGGYPSSPTPK